MRTRVVLIAAVTIGGVLGLASCGDESAGGPANERRGNPVRVDDRGPTDDRGPMDRRGPLDGGGPTDGRGSMDGSDRTGGGYPGGAEPDIVLQNFGLRSMDDVEYTENALREYADRGLKGFYAFGESLGRNDPRRNPNFEFSSVKAGAPIIAAIDGTIGFIKDQPETGDSEVMLQPRDGSIWTVAYDHLTNLKVAKGDRVKAGDVLGEPSVQNNGTHRFEFQVNKGQNTDTLHICPSTIVDGAKAPALLAELTAMQERWNSLSGKNLYDTKVQSPIGCLVPMLTPAQAEGR